MPSLIDLRRRIRAVKSTEQITKAMKTVAASKLRRAQDRIVNARPFASLMRRVLADLAERNADAPGHPLLAAPRAPEAPVLLFLVTADKGLCGSFNSHLVREASSFIVNSDKPVALGLVGRKGRDYFGRRGVEIRFEMVNLFSRLTYAHAEEMARIATEQYVDGEVSRVVVLYNEFKSVLQQKVVVDQLLPIPTLQEVDGETVEGLADGSDLTEAGHLFEPAAEQIFADLLPHHVETQCFRVLLESAAAEHAARMTAMDAATRNAGEMIDGLTLHMNKVRQAAITRELIEVVSGAEAL
ncbi:MAG: ATP synthase F1 subunit gamma [Acidobacteria bacterium]|nr:ATP synthase F1 subunit gamma [Acidobacteriota bacterium]MYD71217.1 ATP synthase F1 subunit gamma [Acidobacteriota bacterium]MYJ03911.1 ATP synthase F1 subunit gamma [Acidobacteriota bacterium]